MVVFVGAESTGKSTLALSLAERFAAGFVPEVGRFIWEEKQGRLTADDYVEIAERHRDAEDAALAHEASSHVFVDTNALTTLLLGLCFGQVTEPVPPALLHYADDCRTRYLHRLHAAYGPVVRIAPHEVAFASLAGVREIYGSGGSGYDKTEFYNLFQVYGRRYVGGGHRLLRRAWTCISLFLSPSPLGRHAGPCSAPSTKPT